MSNTNHQDRLLEIEKDIEDIRIQRLNLWSQEDKIHERHRILEKKNKELFTEYLTLRGIKL